MSLQTPTPSWFPAIRADELAPDASLQRCLDLRYLVLGNPTHPRSGIRGSRANDEPMRPSKTFEKIWLLKPKCLHPAVWKQQSKDSDFHS